MDVAYTKVDYEGNDQLQEVVEKAFHQYLGVKQDGFMFSPAYKSGHWDGIIDFYEKEGQQFPTGIVNKVEAVLGELQNHIAFQYEIVDNRPDAFMELEELPDDIVLADAGIGEITLRDYQYDALAAIIRKQTGIVHISTNGGKTEIAAGIIQQLRPRLEAGETIAFFTSASAIFNQSAARLEERLGIKVGKYGNGKKDIRQVNVVMIPTITSALKADPEKGLKLTAKERVLKKMAKEIGPKFVKGVNQKQMIKAFLLNFEVKTKADEDLLFEIEKVLYESESDAKIIFRLNAYNVEYQNLIKKKNKKVFDKYHEAVSFLEDIAVLIADEAHHSTSDTWYRALMQCSNAQYRVGLTGSIDTEDKVLVQRMQSIFGEVSSRTTNDFLIGEGHSAKPKIVITPIHATLIEGKTVDISNEGVYMYAYEKGIVKNEYRNLLIAKITEMWYTNNKGVLIIVNRIDHGNSISELLSGMNIKHEFVHGEMEIADREERLTAMKNGELKVMIATSLIDEGVDISGIDALIMAAGGKSLRQTLQRIGRVLRKKKTGENIATVFDFEDRTHKHLLKHAKKRKAIYEDEGFEIQHTE